MGADWALPKGFWNNVTTYPERSLVQRGMKLWLALADNTNVEPGTNAAVWFEQFSFRLESKLVPGTSYEIIPADDGIDLWVAQGCAITYSPLLELNFACSGVQLGTGQVTFPAVPNHFTKTRAQGSVFGVKKDSFGVRAFGDLVP